jgi:hypothetical protein
MEIVDQAAWDVGCHAQRLVGDYYTHMAALHVASDPRAANFAPPLRPGQQVPLLDVPRGDGTNHTFHFNHFLKLVRDPQLTGDFKKAWLASSLLTIGDTLGTHNYFGHAPEAELIRHLRNGVAHKNRFAFHPSVIERRSGLLRHPAHNRRYTTVLTMREYTIDTHLQGTEVLFGYGGAAVLLDILTCLGWHLTRTGTGFAPGTA